MDTVDSATRSAIMRGIGTRDTIPELALRSALWARGMRYRLQRRIGTRRPDLVFVAPRLAVFVDGCFWHGCPTHYSLPQTNAVFWQRKIARNRARDEETTQAVAQAGWRVVRFWECEIEEDLPRVVASIQRTIRELGVQRKPTC